MPHERPSVLVELALADAVFFEPNTIAISDGQGGWWVSETTRDRVVDRLYCGADGEAADVIEARTSVFQPNARKRAPAAQGSLDFSAPPPAPEAAAVPIEPASVEAAVADAPEVALEPSEAADKPLMLAESVVRIDAERLEDLRARIKSANKRIQKLGVGVPFVLEVVGRGHDTRMEAVEGAYGRTEYRKTRFTVPYCDVRVTGEAPVVGGHSVGALLEHRKAGDGYRNLVRVIDRDVLGHVSLEEMGALPPHCRHCRMDRRRNTTFLLTTPQGGPIQVGATCLEDYTRDTSAVGMLKLFSLYEEVINDLRSFTDDYARAEAGGGRFVGDGLSPELVLAVAAFCTQQRGFVSSKQESMSIEDGRQPLTATWRYVEEALLRVSRGASPFTALLEIDDDTDRDGGVGMEEPFFDTARRVIEWVTQASPADPTNEYLYNLKTLCTAEHVTYRDIATLTSGISAYQRSMVTREQDAIAKRGAAFDRDAGHLGKPGEKLWMRLYVTRVSSKHSQFGPTYIYGFNTEDGHDLVYFSSRQLQLRDHTGNPVKTIQPNEWVWLSFTVKSHGSFKGKASTTITRGEVQSGPKPEAPAKRGRKRG